MLLSNLSILNYQPEVFAMKKAKMLASITADTSRIESKVSALLEMLPEHIPDKLLGMFTSLTGDVCFVDDSSAVGTGSTIDIVYTLDFDPTAYSQIIAAARALKFNLAH